MKKNKITARLSLRAKFKGSDTVELVIMDAYNNIQVELIPIKLVSAPVVEETEVERKQEEIVADGD